MTAPIVIAGRFQFLGRNSGRSDGYFGLLMFVGAMFQFLGRNSGRSDIRIAGQQARPPKVSIPRSEFWSFGQGSLDRAIHPGNIVSIPRSEFWSFGLTTRRT